MIKNGDISQMQLYVIEVGTQQRIPAYVAPATHGDFIQTESGWQTQWTTDAISAMPNKVCLKRADNDELLGLMSYEVCTSGLAVQIIYIESAGHSNRNFASKTSQKKYWNISRALFAYAAQVSVDEGFGGVLILRAKTSELVRHYHNVFGAQQISPGRDPFQMIIWDEQAEQLISFFEEESGV